MALTHYGLLSAPSRSARRNSEAFDTTQAGVRLQKTISWEAMGAEHLGVEGTPREAFNIAHELIGGPTRCLRIALRDRFAKIGMKIGA